ncbi:hypothetical protein Ciccas_002174 [Cichlidogyrus casuarinus]|uniref:DNA polymerase epsilon catalytic subunit n=1 Tax=Cichlidogyrus casuarinus TaxID=1844966 RepID=A0ABD2QIZ5_9PLAT
MAYKRNFGTKFQSNNAKGTIDPDMLSVGDSLQIRANEQRINQSENDSLVDMIYGFEPLIGSQEKIGWLFNIQATDSLDENKRLVSALNLYFIEQDGSRFRATIPYLPYFLLQVNGDSAAERDVTTYLTRKYSSQIAKVEQIFKDDLDAKNHLVGLKASYLKVSFFSVNELVSIRRDLASHVKKNKALSQVSSSYSNLLSEHFSSINNQASTSSGKSTVSTPLDYLIDIREFDVPYTVRVCIDMNIFCAHWYNVKSVPGQSPTIMKNEHILSWPDPVVLAFDIETTKLPLKFPDSAIDQIMMISYMIDGQGFLLCNREIISQDIADFEYTPKPEFHGPFKVKNLANEAAVIQFFFDHIRRVRPNVITTYNGDSFDWPFVESRAKIHGLSMLDEIGFRPVNSGSGKETTGAEYLARTCAHLDCIRWVKRDSYLPVGAHGLKAVTKAKLNYNPVEVDPEVMCTMARENPVQLANYSVSDAVATYYLYMKYVHPFVFALCTILPLNADDVLRKGSGTLCEDLLMVEAFRANVVFPLKQSAEAKSDSNTMLDAVSKCAMNFTEDGHLIQSETYVGGHVEALECGVFRSDIPVRFRLVPAALESLKADALRCIRHGIAYELGLKEDAEVDEVVTEEEINNVLAQVKDNLESLSMTPNRLECPVIYHLDVGAMYPNIILTNRLQPSAVAADANDRCPGCHFYKPGVACQRFMPWTWRGDLWTASRSEVYRIQAQLNQERFPSKNPFTNRIEQKAFFELSRDEQAAVHKKRMTDFCRRAYKRIHTTRVEERQAMICQRENSFYVDTVRDFRDRRYKFKGLAKEWKKKLDEVSKGSDVAAQKEANSMTILYDSLQLAHKCILNSFYGYVMRRGARWYSMEMAGIVCHTGANIITKARQLIEQVGRALELDTDGIWCILPASFPQNFPFKLKNGKRISMSYPGAILNLMVNDLFTNDQYHELVDSNTLTYKVRSENSIYFEVDGPYLAMVLPAAKEEGKKLKKRYAVFNFDGSLAELKGFEIKRNGELQLIKIFQSSVFEAFLNGKTLMEVYASAAKVADYWLNVLFSKGANMRDEELSELISEKRSMSRKLEDYEGQKSTSISTAKRLAEFLGDAIVKDAGLSCRFIISKLPEQAPVTERAIPLAIFQADPKIKRFFLRKWLKDNSIEDDIGLRDILDWKYYIERLGSAIQKIITIPAALQQVSNPVPRIPHPDWLAKKLSEKTDTFKQRKLMDMVKMVKNPPPLTDDLEDLGSGPNPKKRQREEDVIIRPWREEVPELINFTWDKMEDRSAVDEWLSLVIKKWDLQEKRHSQQEKIRGQQSSVFVPSKKQCGLAGYLSLNQLALVSTVWQVIELVPDRVSSGQYTVWVIVELPGLAPALHSIKLRVPRTFYVNLCKPKANPSGALYRQVSEPSQKSGYVLPRSHPPLYLYEYKVPEEVYLCNSKELMFDLASPDVVGVYEAKVPQLFRVMAALGCMCSVRQTEGKTKVPKSTNFQLDALEFRSLTQHSYLKFGTLKPIFLFYYQLPTQTRRDGERQLYLLVIPWTRRAYVAVTDPAGRTNNQLKNLPKVYQKQLRNLGLEPEELETEPVESELEIEQEEIEQESTTFTKETEYQARVPKKLSFEVKIDTEANATRKQMQKWLTGVRSMKSNAPSDKNSGAPLVVLLHSSSVAQSSREASEEMSWALGEQILNRRRNAQLPILNEFPVIPLGGTGEETDSQLELQDELTQGTEDAYSLMNWQQTAIRRGLRFFAQSEVRLARQLELARYLHVPVGNVPTSNSPSGGISDISDDKAVAEKIVREPCSSFAALELGCDLFYARHLAKHTHLWWCSCTDQPDLGGKATNDQRLLMELDQFSTAELNVKGSFSNVSVEVELAGLALNTILIAHRIPELEGATPIGFDTLGATSSAWNIDEPLSGGAPMMSYDETTASAPAFKILRNMVVAWVKDVTQFRSALADEHLIHFYQWLRSPRSLLYDPALHRTLHTLMKKIFFKLVDELTKASVDVIYGSFNRLVLNAHRSHIDDTIGQIDHLARNLRQKPFFSHLDFHITNAWSFLLWLDPANYAGIKLPIDAENEPEKVEPLQQQDQDPDEDSDFEAEAENPNTARIHEEQEDKDNEDPKAPQLDMHWHLARYLPQTKGIRQKFFLIVAAFLLGMHKAVHSELERQLSQGPENVSSAGLEGLLDVSLAPNVLNSVQEVVSNEIATELYDFVQRLRTKIAPQQMKQEPSLNLCGVSGLNWLLKLNERSEMYLAEKDAQFYGSGEDIALPLLPPHPGAYAGKMDPVLDFVKILCQVLGLDKRTDNLVTVLRRDLLKLAGYGEFSPLAEFRPPTEFRDPRKMEKSVDLLIKIPELCCSACNAVRELDVCRDTSVVQVYKQETPDEAGLNYFWTWTCPFCNAFYSRSHIESLLMFQLRQLSLRHCLQDLKCSKCVEAGGIQEHILAGGVASGRCENCASPLILTEQITGESFLRTLSVYAAVGHHFGLHALLQCANILMRKLV